MTFYEAAVEVLRRTGRPLHYKKITEIAVRENLLSHVGKSPGETMNDRLEKEVKKNDGSVIDQKRPGVFQLLDEEGAEELIERIKEKQKARKKRSRSKDTSNDHNDTRQHNQSRQRSGDDGGGDSSSDDRKRRRSRGSKSTTAKKKRKRDDGDSTPARKKKKKKNKNRSRSDDGGSSDQDSGHRRRRRRRSSDDDGNKKKRSRDDRGGNDRSGRKRSAPSAPSKVTVSDQTHFEEGPVRLEGIPRAAYNVLDENGGGEVPIDELADRIFEQKMVKFHTHDPVTTVKSALANDNQIRADRGHRPLFDHDDAGNWWLTKRNLSASIYEKEQAILSLTEEIRQESIDQLGDMLRDIRAEALEYLALTLLERLGYYNIKVSKRSSQGDVFFTADWRQGLADVRVCVRVVTDSDRTLKSSAVEDLRETLDHYSASEGVAIHLGDVADDAVDRARVGGEAPITLLDRQTFVELLIKHGIGVKTYQSPLVTVDADFFDALAH